MSNLSADCRLSAKIMEQHETFPTGQGVLVQAADALDAKDDMIAKLREALNECEDYFDNRADAEWFPDSPRPVPNAEMTLLCVVRGALGASK
jgi:hypothetical protein